MFDTSVLSGQWSWLIMGAAGLAMAFNPCMLAMTPIAAGYAGRGGRSGPAARVLVSLFFVLGFAGTLALLGFGAGSLGEKLVGLQHYWAFIMAVVYLAMGAYLLRLQARVPVRVYGFYQHKRLRRLPKPGGLPGAMLLGMVFGLTPAPCITPVIAVVLTYVVPTANPLYGAGLLFAYGVGHGLPLFLGGTLGGFLKTTRIASWWEKGMRTLVGLLLLILGIYFLFYGQQLFFGGHHS